MRPELLVGDVEVLHNNGNGTFTDASASSGCSTASSYQSASDRRVHFGLGGARGVQRVEVRWPSGTVQVLKDVPINTVMEIVEPPA